MDPAQRWGSAEFTHTLAEVSWMASTAVLMHLNERATGDPARDWLSSWAHQYFVGSDLRVLVLGCGEGWLERAVAEWPYVAHIDAVDVSEEAVARARAAGGPKIAYSVIDLNRDRLNANAYDVIVAHSILHHVENLEHAFVQIEQALKPEATLIVNEYVGPNRFQFTDRQMEIINALLAALPERLRRGHIEKTAYARKERPDRDFMIANDPSEAVRSEDLLPMIRDRFEVLESKPIGGTILMHLLYDIVQNFRFDNPIERALIEMLCATEGALVDGGKIASDYVILATRKKTAKLPRTAFTRPLPPRTPAARLTERDPLGFGRVAKARKGEGALEQWHLKILRAVLASTRPKRANLIAERKLNEMIERARFKTSGAGPFDWIRARCPSSELLPMIEAIQRLLPA